MRITLLLFLFSCFVPLAQAQEDHASEGSSHWGLTAGLGQNTSSTDSKYASFSAFHWSLGLKRSWGEAPRLHTLYIKYQVFGESFNKLPYYALDANQNVVASEYKQRNRYGMLYIGWHERFSIRDNLPFVEVGAGFNYMLPARYRRILSEGTGKQSYGRPNNFFVTRPQLSLGLGFAMGEGPHQVVLKPTYTYNFTFKHLNLVPTFHAFSLEATYNF